MGRQRVQMSDEELVDVDRWIYRLARGRGRLRLRVGQALAMNGEAQHHEYGFSTFGAYALERLSMSARWAAESRALARRLAELPLVRAALEEGRIGWSMAEVLARDATAEDEDELLEQAQRESIRAVRATLAARRASKTKAAALAGDEASAPDGEARWTAPELLAQDPLARKLGIVVEDLCEQGERLGRRASAGCEPGPERPRDLGVVSREEGEEPLHALAITAPVEEQWALEMTRMAIEHVHGAGGSGGWIETLLAEGLSTIVRWFPGADPISDEVRARQRAWRQAQALLEEQRAQAERAAEGAVLSQREAEAGDAPGEDDPIPEDPWERERRIRQWCAELASRELWLGMHLDRFFAADGWRRLGYASETQYAQERLGSSRASMRKYMRLARQTEHLESLSQAIAKGEVGLEAALMLTRILGPDNEEAWVERAKRRTHKHLREELQAVETYARMLGLDLADAEPPTDEEMEAWFELEREVVTGQVFRRAIAQMSAGETAQAGAADASVQMSVSAAGGEPPAADGVVQMSVSAGDEGSIQAQAEEARQAPSRMRRGVVTRYVLVRESTLLFWRQMEDSHRRSGMEMSFLTFMVCSFWSAWGPSFGVAQDSLWQHIYDRDRRQCTCPVCTRRRMLEAHHLERRSQGGGHEAENVGTACDFCHRPGVHEGRIQVFPPASRMRWRIGRKALLEVVGREKRVLA